MYGTCRIDGCTNTTIDNDMCHYHASILDRICAYYYHNKLSIPVEWCSRFDKRIAELDCESCNEKIEPMENIELIEKLAELNQGG